jgi:hypothetical protein
VNPETHLAKILTSFVDPRQSFGPDKVIPPEILANAKVRHSLFCGEMGFGNGENLLLIDAGSGL